MTHEEPERLDSMGEIIKFTGIPRRTFYSSGYADNLKKSAYIFSRVGRYGRKIYWSYKRLILAWMVENFTKR